MYRSRLTTQRLAAAFFLGWVFFNYPLFALFNKTATVLGVPLLHAYIFAVWLILIVLIALVIEGRQD